MNISIFQAFFHSRIYLLWQRMSTVVMQSLAYLQHSSSVPGAKLFISGDLRLQQKAPLPHRGVFNVYNVSTRLNLLNVE